MKTKKILNVFWTILILLCAGNTLTACSSDDDENQPTGQGELEVAELKALVLDDKGQIAFDATDTKGLYQIGLESLDDARSLAALYAGKGFTGQAKTRTLPDNKGTVEVSIGDNGVFYQVHFAVAGIPEFKLNLCDGSAGGNAFSVYHKCNVCGFTWKSTFNRCPREGNPTYHRK